MKCIAVRKCQAHNRDGYLRFYGKGQVDDFAVCPTHFRPIEGEEAMPINFDTAQEQELLESEFDLDKLKAYIKEKYDKKAGSRGKEKTIAFLIDCRYRSLDIDPNDVVI